MLHGPTVIVLSCIHATLLSWWCMNPDRTAIQLDTHGNCPHCGRPVIGLSEAACTFCGRSLEDVFPDLPDVKPRLQEIAFGWTPERLTQWARPRPAQLAWALATGNWDHLGHWVHEQVWRSWARLYASLKGRSRAWHVDSVEVEGAALAGLGEELPWVALRVWGRREAFTWDPATGQALSSEVRSEPFNERWRIVPTGRPAQAEHLQCPVCAGSLEFEDERCSYCGAPLQLPLGPWLLVDLGSVRAVDGPFLRSPFEAHLLGLESGE